METLHNSTLSETVNLARLRAGEPVLCLSCHNGFYQPTNPEAKVNHNYACDNCGDRVHWDPVVEIT